MAQRGETQTEITADVPATPAAVSVGNWDDDGAVNPSRRLDETGGLDTADVDDTDLEDADVEDTDVEDTDVEDTDVEDTDGLDGGAWARRGGIRHAVAAVVCLVVGLIGGAAGFGVYSWWTKPLPTPIPPIAASAPSRPPTPNAGAVRTQLKDMADYQAAQADYKTQVPVGGDGRLGRQITGDSAVLDATGKVTATVDFSRLGEDAVIVSPDGTTVTVVLPRARTGDVTIDYNRTQVTQRQRGIWTRVSGREIDTAPAYNQAASNIRAEADKSDLRQRAEENTRAMLTGLLKSLGFEHVEVRFEDPKG